MNTLSVTGRGDREVTSLPNYKNTLTKPEEIVLYIYTSQEGRPE